MPYVDPIAFSPVDGISVPPSTDNPDAGGGTIQTPDIPIADPGDGSSPGSSTVVPEVPGDLGTRFTNLSTYLLLIEARRQSSTINGMYPYNHRYRGHREAHKFNLEMQRTVTMCGLLYLSLRDANTSLTTSEIDSMYPTDTEIQNYYHCSEQLRFKEWLLIKDEDKRWYI